ncbi:26S protease regulatory subunit [Thermococcus sp.]|uniref:ATP-binding protein n=1 Tax=Thermococcus sp. TaxID=35749 RepID=UPI0025D4E92C|nr:ATP-binding protein [Thermococcus sp.]
MQSLYLSLFEDCKREYEKALEAGDLRTAADLAKKCAEILAKISEKIPSRREFYLEKAKKWSIVADNLIRSTTATEAKNATFGNKRRIEDEYVSIVENLISHSTITWDDIGGLEDVKRLLAKNVALALAKKPDAIKPWKGILLFGPPGTGKTLLASATAGSLNATFFNVKASAVLSKYFGESSKLISALYQVARERTPSIVFIDEIDALTPKRENVHEATRRTLATLLTEIDGFKSEKDRFVLTLVSTNTPWDLDEAILSRFPLRIYVPLPDREATKAIIRIHTKGLDISHLDLDTIAEKSMKRLYSGREIAALCQVAIHNMLEHENPELLDIKRLTNLENLELKVRPLEMWDFEKAFKKIKSPLTRKDIGRYERWAQEFGT